jgi:hypothetical protein
MRRFAAAYRRLPASAQYALVGAVVFAVTFLLTVNVGHAQDSTAVVDRTGLFGPVIDKFWPVIVTFLTSLAVKIIAQANAAFARTSEPVKWAALYAFALLFNFFARWVHITELDPTAPLLVLSLVQTGAAALVYKFGGHAVPKVETPAASRRIG